LPGEEAQVSETSWKIEVDRNTCIGSAVCAGTSPSRFTIVGDRAQPVDAEVEPDEDVLAAAESCPMEAIRVVEQATGKVLVPEE
jgi:ferredoxin